MKTLMVLMVVILVIGVAPVSASVPWWNIAAIAGGLAVILAFIREQRVF